MDQRPKQHTSDAEQMFGFSRYQKPPPPANPNKIITSK